MISFSAPLMKFGKMGEKTGWTYIIVTQTLAEKLIPGNKKSFRVKGKIDRTSIEKVALIPMGGGDFIIPVNATMRKALKKQKGDIVQLNLEVDHGELALSSEFIECLQDEPEALEYFNSLPKSHRNYYSKWIESAKTSETKTKRIAKAINGLSKKYNFAQMLKS
jgi:hypothetical protein